MLDLYLSYADPECAHNLPFSLTVEGDTFTVTDGDDEEVAYGDISDANSTPWGSRTVHEWVTATYVLRVVVREDLLTDGTEELDSRTVNRLASRVDSLAVSTDLSGGRRKTGNVALANGYNTDLTLVEPTLTDGGKYVKQIRIDVTPQGGLGRAPGCEEIAPLVRSINNAAPDASGNIIIAPGGGKDNGQCFRIQLPAVITGTDPRTAAFPNTAAAHTIKIESDCAPCCSCDYFVRTYEGLRRMIGRWQQLVDDAAAVRDIYHRNRERWLAQRRCRMDHPLVLSALPLKECYFSVSATFCNMSGTCIRPVEVRLTVGADGDTPATYCSPAYINGSHTKGDEKYTPAESATVPGGVPVFVATFPYLDPQDQAHFRTRLRVIGCHQGLPVHVTATVHAPDTPGSELPAAIDDGTQWGSTMPTRAKDELWVAAVSAPPSFCCEDD